MAAMNIAVIGGEGGVDMGEGGAILEAGKVALKADQFAGHWEVETLIFLPFIHETVDIVPGASNPAVIAAASKLASSAKDCKLV